MNKGMYKHSGKQIQLFEFTGSFQVIMNFEAIMILIE